MEFTKKYYSEQLDTIGGIAMTDLVRNRQGHILLETIIIMPLILVVLFLSFSFSVTYHKRSVLNNVLDMALQKAAVAGGLTSDIRGALFFELDKHGFDSDKIKIEPLSYVEKNRGEIITISIAISENGQGFNMIQAIGGEPFPDIWQIKAEGSIMSEKLP